MTNPWLERRVIAYAHQGGAKEGPSSTLMAMEMALAAGATGLELDVHATVDGHLVVCHDTTVDRTTDAHGAISSLTLAEVKQLDNAHWWVPGYQTDPGRPPEEYPLRGKAPAEPDLGVASLEDVLERFPGVILNLDIKQTAPAVPAYEADLAALLRRYGRVDDVIVASFDDRATDAFSEAAPEIPTSAGTAATAAFWQAVAEGTDPPPMRHVALQIPASYGEVVVTSPALVEAAHRSGVAVHVWTIDDRPEMERLLDMGVDGIISDNPSILVDVLRRRGVAWRP